MDSRHGVPWGGTRAAWNEQTVELKEKGPNMRTFLNLILPLAVAGSALASVGVGPDNSQTFASRDLNNVIITETGQITLSSDGLGIVGTSGLIQVDKPSAGATVRAAYLASASTGFSGYVISDNEITLAGSGVVWSSVIPNGIFCFNHFADVTSIVAPVLNPAPAGITDLELTEPNSSGVDGSALYVIFNDPATAITRTAIIAFGAQATTGDQFNIGFGQPVDVDANTVIEMGLAISYGAQGQGDCQVSEIDVNGNRLTSDAGHMEDGEFADSALLTVGGIGDSRSNPANPFGIACNTGIVGDDDELYDIAGFVNDGDTGVTVNTFNPSNNDNIFVAHLLLDFAAVVGEGAVLTPAQAVNCLCEPHTVTLTVQNDQGEVLADTPSAIWVESGPGVPAFIQGLTNGLGQISLTYTSCTPGMDVIVGNFLNSLGEWELSNRAIKIWERCDVGADETPATFALSQNVPNPFNPTTSISFTLGETGVASLKVFDLAGREVATLVSGVLARGAHSVEFDGANLASGVYVYTLQAGTTVESRKMVLMK
jgi:hypothetical protein